MSGCMSIVLCLEQSSLFGKAVWTRVADSHCLLRWARVLSLLLLLQCVSPFDSEATTGSQCVHRVEGSQLLRRTWAAAAAADARA